MVTDLGYFSTLVLQYMAARVRKKLATSFDALVSPRDARGAFGAEAALLSADDEERAAALLRQLDFEEAQLDSLTVDLRLSLTPEGTPCKEVGGQNAAPRAQTLLV